MTEKKTLHDRLIRSCGRWSDFFLLAAVISFVLIEIGALLGHAVLALTSFEKVAGDLIGGELSEVPGSGGLISPETLLNGRGVAGFFANYLMFFGIWVVILLVVLIFRRNRPMFKCLGKRIGGKTFLSAGIGLLLGFGMNGICVLISWLMGDIHLSFNEFRPGLFFLFLLAVVIQSGAEEIGMRWYLYQKLRRRYRHPAVAIIINAAVFAAMHLLNPGISVWAVIQIAAVGVLLSLLVFYYDGLWMAVFFHAAWNFTQNIVFGLPNSGIVSEYSLFRLEAASARNGIFYNTSFGIEGSIGAAAILVLGCVVLLIINRKKYEKRDLWAEAES